MKLGWKKNVVPIVLSSYIKFVMLIIYTFNRFGDVSF